MTRLKDTFCARFAPRLVGILAGAAAMSVAPAPAFAQDAATTNTTVRIPGETRIEKLGDLHFGDIIPGASGGTITIDVDGTVSTTGTVQSLGGNPQPAEFTITRQILVDYPTYGGPDAGDTVQLAHIGLPTETMTLRDFTTDFERTIFFGLPAYFFQTDFDFRVAGTLDVASDQEPGSYLGFFTVVIDYD